MASDRRQRTFVFVYGTLLRGCSNAGMLGDSPRWPATTRGTLYNAPAGYPALVPGGNLDIKGELVELANPRELTILDLLEGVADGLYRRQTLPVRSGGRQLRAHAYVIDEADARRRGYRRLKTDDWRGSGPGSTL